MFEDWTNDFNGWFGGFNGTSFLNSVFGALDLDFVEDSGCFGCGYCSSTYSASLSPQGSYYVFCLTQISLGFDFFFFFLFSSSDSSPLCLIVSPFMKKWLIPIRLGFASLLISLRSTYLTDCSQMMDWLMSSSSKFKLYLSWVTRVLFSSLKLISIM